MIGVGGEVFLNGEGKVHFQIPWYINYCLCTFRHIITKLWFLQLKLQFEYFFCLELNIIVVNIKYLGYNYDYLFALYSMKLITDK